jgi:3-oxoacyl-[acyl-carrier-protein] synthase II
VQRVLAGGYDAISQMVFGGFDSLQALSQTQCRPFDAHRDGLALGEGAAMLALETLESATKRNAEILGEIVGYGAATDCHHLTQPHPNGDAALASMTAACAAARVTPDKINYVNAHGTGTPLNDSAEAAAINRWAGEAVGRIPVSSTKASIGHLLGAAGSVEAVICLMTLREQWLPPTATLQTLDPACRFPFVQKPTDAKVDYALTNSFGFGGANATLILRRWM